MLSNIEKKALLTCRMMIRDPEVGRLGSSDVGHVRSVLGGIEVIGRGDFHLLVLGKCERLWHRPGSIVLDRGR